MSNPDLVLAQLQRRNRILIVSLFACLAASTVGFVILLLDTDTLSSSFMADNRKVLSPDMEPKHLEKQQPKQAELQDTLSELSDAQKYKPKFLAAMESFNGSVKASISTFPELAESRRYTELTNQLEADIVKLARQGRYKDAITSISNATSRIEKWTVDELNRFENLIAEVEIAWQDKALLKLSRLIDKAYSIYTGDRKQLDRYRHLSADWPAVDIALQRANIAKAENRLAAEQKALSEISQLRHDIAGLDDRIRAVKQNLHQENINNLLNQIARALATNDASRANTALKKLKSIAPETAEISKLDADLKQLEKKILYVNAMQKMDELAAADQWIDALQIVKDHRQIFNNYEKFQQRADFIDKIYSLIVASTAIVEEPQKLIDLSIKKQARKIIENAQTLRTFSPSLNQLIDKLDELLVNYSTEISITVVSDNFTYVEVKYVGQVGLTVKKTIKLPPGDYIFEGKRKGFITVRVPLKLRPGDNGTEILVIANEQI